MVSRCFATEAQDGVRRAFNYDSDATNDAFCLDGQRLVPIARNGNTTEYRTETDTYSKILRVDDTTSTVRPDAGRYTKGWSRLWAALGVPIAAGSSASTIRSG